MAEIIIIITIIYMALQCGHTAPRAPHKQLNEVSLSKQVTFKLGFERVNGDSKMNNRRETVPASRTGSRESMIAKVHPHSKHTEIGLLKRSWPKPDHGGMTPSAAITQVLWKRVQKAGMYP